jgi:hypothetical protein
MRKSVAIGLMMMLTAVQPAVFAAGQAAGALTGIVRGGHMQPLTGMRVQLRDVQSGNVIGSTTAAEAGSFSFPGLPPGTYFVEAVDASGKVLGVGAPVSLASGATATTSVIAPGVGEAAASAAAGFHLLGMGPVTSVTVLGAAAAASVTAVAVTRPNASPSR